MERFVKRVRRISIKEPSDNCVKADTLNPCDTIKETRSQTQFELVADVSRIEIKTAAGTHRIDGQGRLEFRFDSIVPVAGHLGDDQTPTKSSRKQKKPGRPRSPEVDKAIALRNQDVPWSQVPRLITTDFAQWGADKQRLYRERLQRAVLTRLSREKPQIA